MIALAGIFNSVIKEYELFPERTENNLKQLYVKCNDGYRKVTECIISGEYTGVESGKYASIVLPT